MVKVRGFRVELQEIEAVLSAHPDVNATAVAVRDISGESQIVAYVVPREGAAMRTTDLRACLAERLPEYMRPSRFVLIDDLPLTSLGKVDRARLPEVGPERPQLDAHYEAAVDDLEAEIGRLWEALLQVEGIGMEDNFLYLGGDSVFATMLTARLCDRFDIDLSVAVLFECPTVRTLAAYVRPLITTVPEPGAVSHAPSAAIDG
jgi:acyl carrier protein